MIGKWLGARAERALQKRVDDYLATHPHVTREYIEEFERLGVAEVKRRLKAGAYDHSAGHA